ncbi:DUF4147 domain-containing protein [Candidatus Woesearchaeota archaeon]|nr:DUF4147 domain-containing protein [Candidatus Woesearchaeota archaeon]
MKESVRSLLQTAFSDAISQSVRDAKLRLRKDVAKWHAGRVFIVGWGKSSDVFIEDLLKSVPRRRLAGCAYLSLKKSKVSGKVWRFHATHPVITSQNINGSKRIVKMLSDSCKDDLVVIISSGGGSAMFEVLDSKVSLAKAQECIRSLLRKDVDIRIINYIRKACSLVKGGRLIPLIGSDNVLVYVVSDIVLPGGPSVAYRHVASGPTMGEGLSETQRREIRSSIRRSGALRFIPESVLLERADNCSPRRGQRVRHSLLCDNSAVQDHLAKSLEKKGFVVKKRKTAYMGESSKVAEMLMSEFRRELRKTRKRPLAYICGGESTVEVKRGGKGGRLQDLAARVIEPLSKIKTSHFFGFASDGQDFIPGVGGVYVNSRTYGWCRKELQKRILESNTYSLHKRLGSHLRPGKAVLNVSDILVFLEE